MAFAGDYLSAASFLGICGMIAFYGYDGFLYSIGYLAGWIVALFVIAEPMKRLGKFTFADALNAKFQSRGIQLAAGISTLAVSVFYLIPQMVGAGVLVQPLLGFDHWVGVVMVGAVVIMIVVTAGMVSTTWVQFLKGSLLVFFSAILTVLILQRGFEEQQGGKDDYQFRVIRAADEDALAEELSMLNLQVLEPANAWQELPYVSTTDSNEMSMLFRKETKDAEIVLRECQTITKREDGETLINGQPQDDGVGSNQLHSVGYIESLPTEYSGGPVGPVSFLQVLSESEIVLWGSEVVAEADASTTVYYPKPTPGTQVLRPASTRNSPVFARRDSGPS